MIDLGEDLNVELTVIIQRSIALSEIRGQLPQILGASFDRYCRGICHDLQITSAIAG